MKRIELHGKRGEGLAALVDDRDFDHLSSYKWYLNADGYACAVIYLGGGRDGKRQRTLRMHRLVIKGEPTQVDHINRNRLDNRRANLRSATNQTNRLNQLRRVDNQSGFKGVWFDPKLNKYQSFIRYQGKRFHICVTADAEEAAWMYDQYAIGLHEEFASPNFEYI